MKSDHDKPQRDMAKLNDELFAKEWELLYRGDETEFRKILKDPRLKNPGVYLLACPEKSRRDLEGQKINVKDVDYVGMSNSKAGLAGRLRQFKRAIEGRRGHSGGNNFVQHKGKYSKLKHGPFYFAVWNTECCNKKSAPEANDFRAMGHVACLEQYAIAYVKEKNRRVPKLNRSAGGVMP